MVVGYLSGIRTEVVARQAFPLAKGLRLDSRVVTPAHQW
jgi:hypothetical protein